ncbi:hypothetical protein BU56_29485 [Escherichia coli O145:H25 str. 07-3858]|nr:hypothetical protein BU56_29485 [Escherichia coli O145:H25 str. 07-3858]
MKGKVKTMADCRSGKRGPFFRLVPLAASGQSTSSITERAGLVERQRGAGLVSSNRKNANGSTVGGAIPHATSLRVAVSSISGVIADAFALNPPGAVAV